MYEVCWVARVYLPFPENTKKKKVDAMEGLKLYDAHAKRW